MSQHEMIEKMNDLMQAAFAECYEYTEVAREILELLKSAGIDKWRYPVIAEIEKKYTEELI